MTQFPEFEKFMLGARHETIAKPNVGTPELSPHEILDESDLTVLVNYYQNKANFYTKRIQDLNELAKWCP